MFCGSWCGPSAPPAYAAEGKCPAPVIPVSLSSLVRADYWSGRSPDTPCTRPRTASRSVDPTVRWRRWARWRYVMRYASGSSGSRWNYLQRAQCLTEASQIVKRRKRNNVTYLSTDRRVAGAQPRGEMPKGSPPPMTQAGFAASARSRRL